MVTVALLNEFVFFGLGLAVSQTPKLARAGYNGWQDRRELKKLRKELGKA